MKTTGYNSAKSWGIAGACSIVNCLVVIPAKIAAILFVEFVDRYETDRQKASLFIIVSGVLRCLIGPFIGYLGEIFELRYITAMGCCIASLGVGLCYFAKDIVALTIFLGFIYGAGFGLANTLIIQIIKQHFNKNIASANGILNAGTCIGALSIIPIFSILLNQYDVSGALLILSGIMMHGVPLAMLLSNPKYKNVSPLSPKMKPSEKGQHKRSSNETTQEISFTTTKKENIPSTHTTLKHIEMDNYSIKEKYITTSQVGQQTVKWREQSLTSISYQSPSNGKLEADTELKSTSIKETILQQISTLEKKSQLRTYFKFLLVFKNMPFLVIMVCESIHTYADVFLMTTVVDISRDKGIARSQEHFFPMFLPVAQTAGYLGLGWVTDKGYLSVTNYMGICFLSMGVILSCLVMTKNFLTTMIATMAYGLCCSGVSIAMPLLVYEFVEESKQSMAIASRLVLYAPLSFTMAPMIGYFRDTFGSYNGALYILSTVCIGTAVLVSLLPCFIRCLNRKK